MTLDSAALAYNNRPVSVPRGMGAESAAHGKNARIDKTSKLYEQCLEFESIFVKMMLKEMRGTIEKSGFIDGGQAEDIFSDMLYDEYAKDMAKTSGFGLSDAVYLELSRNSLTAKGSV